MDTQRTSSFRDLPFMGVIRVVVEATELGYSATDPTWSNLGQGQPEVGELPGAPPRLDQITIPVGDHAYGPVEGLPELREAVAAHYNRLYRRGMKSQYTADNVVRLTRNDDSAHARHADNLPLAGRKIDKYATVPSSF